MRVETPFGGTGLIEALFRSIAVTSLSVDLPGPEIGEWWEVDFASIIANTTGMLGGNDLRLSGLYIVRQGLPHVLKSTTPAVTRDIDGHVIVPLAGGFFQSGVDESVGYTNQRFVVPGGSTIRGTYNNVGANQPPLGSTLRVSAMVQIYRIC